MPFSKILDAKKLKALDDLTKYEATIKEELKKEREDNEQSLKDHLAYYELDAKEQIEQLSDDLYTYTYTKLNKLLHKISENLTPIVARVLRNFSLDDINNEQIAKMIVNEVSAFTNEANNKVRIICNAADVDDLQASLKRLNKKFIIEFKVNKSAQKGECEIDTGLCILRLNCNMVAKKLKLLSGNNSIIK